MQYKICLGNSGLALSVIRNHDVFSQIGCNGCMKRISSEHKHGHRFIVLEHQYDRCDRHVKNAPLDLQSVF